MEFPPESTALVAVFAGQLTIRMLLKEAGHLRIVSARHEPIDIHHPPQHSFL